MNLPIFFIICSVIEGGSRPDVLSTVAAKFDERMATNFSMNLDYDYVTTLDMFDLLQGLLVRKEPNQIEIHNTTNESFNQTFNYSTNNDKVFDIVTVSVTILSALLNIGTIYIVKTAQKPIKQTYYAATAVDDV